MMIKLWPAQTKMRDGDPISMMIIKMLSKTMTIPAGRCVEVPTESSTQLFRREPTCTLTFARIKARSLPIDSKSVLMMSNAICLKPSKSSLMSTSSVATSAVTMRRNVKSSLSPLKFLPNSANRLLTKTRRSRLLHSPALQLSANACKLTWTRTSK